MNPCDHPHGGGEGKSPVGRPGPVTPWGKPALGYKTRSKKHRSDKFIVKRRNGKKAYRKELIEQMGRSVKRSLRTACAVEKDSTNE